MQAIKRSISCRIENSFLATENRQLTGEFSHTFICRSIPVSGRKPPDRGRNGLATASISVRRAWPDTITSRISGMKTVFQPIQPGHQKQVAARRSCCGWGRCGRAHWVRHRARRREGSGRQGGGSLLETLAGVPPYPLGRTSSPGSQVYSRSRTHTFSQIRGDTPMPFSQHGSEGPGLQIFYFNRLRDFVDTTGHIDVLFNT